MIPVYVSDPTPAHTLNARPLYGLFTEGENPFAIPRLVDTVPVVFAPPKGKKRSKPGLYAQTVEAPPEGLQCEFVRAQRPRPLPDEFLDYIKQHFSFPDRNFTSLPSSVIIGWGKLAAEQFGEPQFAPLGALPLNYYQNIMVPYAEGVKKLVLRPASEFYMDDAPIDFGVAYTARDLLPGLYREFDHQPSAEEFTAFVRRQYPDTPDYAEQVARVSLAIAQMAARNGETDRVIGAGVLGLGNRLIPFPYAHSVTPQRGISWADLHNIVSTRVPSQPQLYSVPVVQLELLVAAVFIYSVAHTRHLPEGRTLAYVLLLLGNGVFQETILDMPTHLIPLFPPFGEIQIQRLTLNAQQARRLGQEAWQVTTQPAPEMFGVSPDDVAQLLWSVAEARNKKRPYIPRNAT